MHNQKATIYKIISIVLFSPPVAKSSYKEIRKYPIQRKMILPYFYAHKTHAPPTALILSSACLLKNLAFTMTGCLGNLPFPRSL